MVWFLFRKKEIKSEDVLPGFRIGKPLHVIELPQPKDLKKISVVYPLIEPFAYASIKWEEKEKGLVYRVIEPELNEKEKDLLKKISEALIETLEVPLSSMKSREEAIKYLEGRVKKVVKDFGIKLDKISYLKIMYYIYRNFVGLNEIEPLMHDPNIEDISCDGVNIPVYIIHRRYGSLKTNIVFRDLDYLRDFVVKLAERCGRYVSYAEPILDATLPDGSRVAATLASDVATKGPTFTIRRYTEKPFSPIDQIELKTASSEMMAYFWYIVEHKASILIIGGSATGKTSFLNSLCMFIKPEAKIVSIEDTRELRLPHEHWIPTLARMGFGIPLPTGEKYGQVTLFELLKESFRQNPDYVIVGETRGEETYVMFQGISSGHSTMSTFHAGSIEGAIRRLISPPIQLPPQLIGSLDVVVLMVHAKEKGPSARRVKYVYEIEGVDEKGNLKTNIIFEWDPAKDDFKKVSESTVVKRIAEAVGTSYEEALKEIEIRKKIIEWMLEKGIRDYKEVSGIIMEFYRNREEVIKKLGIKEEKVKVKKVLKKKERKLINIFELFGFKEIRE